MGKIKLKEELEEKFSESKVFLVRIGDCLRRSPNSEDEIVDEAMISYTKVRLQMREIWRIKI